MYICVYVCIQKLYRDKFESFSKKNSRKITEFTKITTRKMNSFIIVKEIESVVTNKSK